MKKKIFLFKAVLSLLIVLTAYTSNIYNTPQFLKIRNEFLYYINHNSDIEYAADNALNNAKLLMRIISEKAGE